MVTVVQCQMENNSPWLVDKAGYCQHLKIIIVKAMQNGNWDIKMSQQPGHIFQASKYNVTRVTITLLF